MWPRRFGPVVVAVASVLGIACSLGVRGPAPGWQPRQEPECDGFESISARKARRADRTATLLLGGIGVAGLVVVFSDTSSDKTGEGLILSGGMLAMAVAFHLARVRADGRVKRCDVALQRHRQCLAHPEACDPEQHRKPNASQCEGAIAAWRAQPDPINKTKLYDRMPARCKALITRDQGAARPPGAPDSRPPDSGTPP